MKVGVKAVKAPPIFTTKRLTLRKPCVQDAEEIFERYTSDAEVTRYLGWPRHRTLRDTEAFLRFSEEEWSKWPAGPYLIYSLDRNSLLGSTGLAFSTPSEAMTGYVLAKDAWGLGYATEALAAVVEIARLTGVKQLSALCHPLHRPSQRVLEKCGFARDEKARARVEYPNLPCGGEQDAFKYLLTLR